MRKLSCKWPIWLTVFAFLRPIFYVWHRIGKPEIFDPVELMNRIVGGIIIAIIIWLVYGVVCLLAPSRTIVIGGQRVSKNCGSCKFSEKAPQTSMDGAPDPEEIKCNLTGYNYNTNYTCTKWRAKQ